MNGVLKESERLAPLQGASRVSASTKVEVEVNLRRCILVVAAAQSRLRPAEVLDLRRFRRVICVCRRHARAGETLSI